MRARGDALAHLLALVSFQHSPKRDWHDVDWLGGTLRIERGVVKQIVDEVKSSHSARTMVCADELHHVVAGAPASRARSSRGATLRSEGSQRLG